MPTDTTANKDNPYGMSMTDIINAALAIYGIKQGQKAPNFYTVPPTAGEEWKTNATKGLFDYASGYTDQFLHGLGNLNPDFSLPSSQVGNPAFMGGIKVPTIDWSKMPARPTGGPVTTTPPPAPTGGTPTHDPFGGPNSGLGGNPNINFPTSGNTGGIDWSDPTVQQVASWIRDHPNIAKGGAAAIGAALGPAAAAVAGAIISWLGGHGGQQPLPTTQPNYPQGILTPGNHGDPVPSLNTPYDQWFNPPPSTTTPFNPQYAGDKGPGYYDPKGGAGTIGTLLGIQMGDTGEGKGPKKF